jgi:hypothetical protein
LDEKTTEYYSLPPRECQIQAVGDGFSQDGWRSIRRTQWRFVAAGLPETMTGWDNSSFAAFEALQNPNR